MVWSFLSKRWALQLLLRLNTLPEQPMTASKKQVSELSENFINVAHANLPKHMHSHHLYGCLA